MSWSLEDRLPAWGSPIHRPVKDTLWPSFRKPWDKKQTMIDLGVSSESEAKRVAPMLIVRYLNDNDPNSSMVLDNKLAKFEDYRLEYLKDTHLNNKENTKASADYVARAFISSLKSPFISDLTWPMFRDYIDGRKQESAVKGIYNTLVNLRVFFDWLMAQKLMKENFARKYPLPSTAEFYVNEVIWAHAEFNNFYKIATKEDQLYLWCIWHTGMDLADLFFLRRKHVVEVDGQYVINKLREKATSPLQRIQFPLENCKAKNVFMDAYNRVSGPEDRLFFPEYEDKEYDQFNWSSRTRRNRLWMRLTPEVQFKTIKQMRHTFVTECVSGKRFGKPIPQYALEKWMGWTPGSKVAARYYTHIPAADTAHLMKGASHL